MGTAVSSRSVRDLLNRRMAAKARMPIRKWVAKLEERLDETQSQVFAIAASQQRSESRLASMSDQVEVLRKSSEVHYDELRRLLSEVLTRLAHFVSLNEELDRRCTDCPQRPARKSAIGEAS